MKIRLILYIILIFVSPPAIKAQLYNVLVWSDEFDSNGAPNPLNWVYDIGGGGWGNSEVETYTNSTDNVRVENGFLILEARKTGSQWTSGRIKSFNLQYFTYGRLEFRAKLPSGAGTWPALWTLGQNQNTAHWPACGEIDVMEEAGKNPGICRGSMHYPTSNRVGKDTLVATAEDDFHIYAVEWDENKIDFYVDNNKYFTYIPAMKNDTYWPFYRPQFMLMNLAMGGVMGSDGRYETGGKKNGIDPALTSARMMIDYVRIYKRDTVAPSVPAIINSDNITHTSFRFNWKSSKDNVAVTGYNVYKNGVLETSVKDTFVNVTELTQGNTYAMTVRAKDASGNLSAVSAVLPVTTLASSDTQAPTTPTGFQSGNTTKSSFTLTWNPSTDNIGVDKYKISLDDTMFFFVQASLNSLTITGLKQYTSYSVSIAAKDAVGNTSPKSSPLVVKTLNDTQPPSVPTGLQASNIGQTMFLLSWTPSTDDVGVAGYDVYQNGTLVTSINRTSVTLIDLGISTTYSMTVKAKDVNGNVSAASSVLQVTTLPDSEAPNVPSVLIKSNVTQTSFTVSWTASGDNVGVIAYDVYRNGTLATSVSGTTATLTGLTPGTTYLINIKARDAAGNVSYGSDILSVTTDINTGTPDVKSNSMMLYPNPANTFVNIELPVRSTIKIFDRDSRIRFSETIGPGLSRIPLNLEAGFYMVQIWGEDKTTGMQKLIVR